MPQVTIHQHMSFPDVMVGLRLPIIRTLSYSGSTRQMIYRFKDHGDFSLRPHLSYALAAGLLHVSEQSAKTSFLVTPIPSRARSLRSRGFCPITDLTRAALHHLAAPAGYLIQRSLLRDIRNLRSDKSLGTADRALVAGGAFRLTSTPPVQPVIVVDDVVTSGATMREAIATLLHSGVLVVGGVALAATPRS
jgi:predicted amidophosphoribosyltransferase